MRQFAVLSFTIWAAAWTFTRLGQLLAEFGLHR